MQLRKATKLNAVRQHLRTVSVPLSILDDLMNMLFLSFFFFFMYSPAHKDSGPPMWQILLSGNFYKDNSMNCDWTKIDENLRRHLILSLILIWNYSSVFKADFRPGGDIKWKAPPTHSLESTAYLREPKWTYWLIHCRKKLRLKTLSGETEYEFGGERGHPSVSGCGSLFHLPIHWQAYPIEQKLLCFHWGGVCERVVFLSVLLAPWPQTLRLHLSLWRLRRCCCC